MRIGIHQPNYLPWLGYFEKMALCDTFVIFDDVQLPRGGHSFETRCVLRGGLELNIPVMHRGMELIKDTKLAEGRWREKHLRSIRILYGDSPRLEQLLDIYAGHHPNLSSFNTTLIRLMAAWMGINPRIVLSSELGVDGQGTEKIIGIVKALRADTYISGVGAGSRRYISDEICAKENIRLVWHNYEGPNISALDSLLSAKVKAA